MKKGLLILTMLTTLTAFSQRQAAVWHFGYEAGLDFNCSPPQPIKAAKAFYTIEGSATMCDTVGNLLFYTTGDTVWNRKHEPMPNGFTLGAPPGWCGGSNTQSSIIVPVPNNDSLFYIFVTDCSEHLLESGFQYAIVDLSLDGGLGDVTVKNQLLVDTVCEKVAAIHHANGTDIWVLTKEFGTNRFFAYEITAAGLNPTPFISSAGQVQYIVPDSECAARGYMKFSPDGDQIAVLSVSDCTPTGFALYPEIFGFDDNTGQVTLDYTLVDIDSIPYYGATFSPNGDILYMSSGWYGSYIHQFDLTAGSAAAILASKTVIYEDTTWGTEPSAMQLGLDGRIYVADGAFVDWINTINNPNSLGLSCNYQEQAITFTSCPSSGYTEYGLPNFIESYFRSTFTGGVCIDTISADFTYVGTCFGFPAYFYDTSLVYPEYACAWEWNFDDPPSGANNTSNLKSPVHTFTSAGTYDVQLTVKTHPDSICKLDTIIKTVTIDVCTGIEDNQNFLPSTNIYPNPFQQTTIIELTNVDNAAIDIYSGTGGHIRHIDNEGQNDLRIELGQDLQAGIYLLTIRTDKAVLTQKLIKIE